MFCTNITILNQMKRISQYKEDIPFIKCPLFEIEQFINWSGPTRGSISMKYSLQRRDALVGVFSTL